MTLSVICVSGGCRRWESASAHVRKAETYTSQKKYQEAIIEYRAALQKDPKLGEARLKLAEVYDAAGDTTNAFGEYLRAADLLPTNLDLQLKAGTLLLYSGRSEDAKTKAEQILAAQPKDVRARILLGNAMARLKDFDAAIADLEEAVRMDPSRTGGYLDLASMQVASGKPAEAESTFRKAIEIDPTSVPARLALANYYWSTDRRGDAEQILRDALAVAPKDVRVNRGLALWMLLSGKPAAAEPYLRTIAAAAQDGASSLSLADYYMLAGRDDDATTVLRALASSPAFFGPASVRLAQLDFRNHRLRQAEQRLDDVLGRDPKDVEALSAKARVLSSEGKLDEALASAKAATAADPRSAGALFVLATVQIARGDYAPARESLLGVLHLKPQATVAQVELARLELASGALQRADNYAVQALHNAPGSPDARQMRIRSLLAAGHTDAAEPEIRRLLKEYPQSPTAHELMGVLLVLQRQVKAGREELERALQIRPDNVVALSNLVTIDLSQMDSKTARARVDERLRHAPDDVKSLVLGARVYAATGGLDQAEKLLKHAVELGSVDLEAYSLLAQLYVARGRLADARDEYVAIIKRHPESVAAQTALGVLYEADKMMAEAEAAYEKALTIDAHAGVAANNLAWLLAQSGRTTDRALGLAQTAKAQMPNDPHVDDTLGWICYKKGLTAQAIEALNHSVLTDPSNPTSMLHLGLAYFKNAEWDKAKPRLNKAVEINPAFTADAEVRDALAVVNQK